MPLLLPHISAHERYPRQCALCMSHVYDCGAIRHHRRVWHTHAAPLLGTCAPAVDVPPALAGLPCCRAWGSGACNPVCSCQVLVECQHVQRLKMSHVRHDET